MSSPSSAQIPAPRSPGVAKRYEPGWVPLVVTPRFSHNCGTCTSGNVWYETSSHAAGAYRSERPFAGASSVTVASCNARSAAAGDAGRAVSKTYLPWDAPITSTSGVSTMTSSPAAKGWEGVKTAPPPASDVTVPESRPLSEPTTVMPASADDATPRKMIAVVAGANWSPGTGITEARTTWFVTCPAAGAVAEAGSADHPRTMIDRQVALPSMPTRLPWRIPVSIIDTLRRAVGNRSDAAGRPQAERD